MHVDWTAVLVALISAVSSYLVGHRRGRKVFRSGDFLHEQKLYEARKAREGE